MRGRGQIFLKYWVQLCLVKFAVYFRLDIFHSKTLLYSFWGRENGLKADRTRKFFSHLNIWLHNQFFICLYIAYEYTYLTSYILHQVHHTQGSCTIFKYTKLLVKFCLIV